MKRRNIWITIVTLLIVPLLTQAGKKAEPAPPPRDLAIEMGAPFHDSMILQREMNVPVWGWSKPGTKATIEFKGQKVSATAGKDGRWIANLNPLKASAEPTEMTIIDSEGNKEILKDVLVGEVWMCSGQSNMQFEAQETSVGWTLFPQIKARVEAGEETMPIIREVKVTNKFSSIYPSYRLKAKWSNEWGGFSAVAFAFSYDIARETQVPVGIVNCSFSTTQIQAWVPREGFAAGTDTYTQEIYRKILINDVTTPEHKAAWEAYEKEITAWGQESKQRVEKGLKPKERPPVPGNMNGNRDATWMCNAKTAPMAPYSIRGAIWNQGYANSNEGLVYRNNLHSLVRGLRTIWNNPELPVYFHQFYASGGASDTFSLMDSASEMRLATWLAHRDLENASMASQIDISGGVHYRNKTVPGQRLARHALKNQYGKDIIANGPMYKNYTTNGDTLVLELDHTEGLCVAQAVTEKRGFTTPVKIENGEDQVELFYLAGKDLVWHKAKMKIVGSTIELTAPGLKEPRGVAYGRIVIGKKPNVYNKAMLPLTPFVFYDHKLVVSPQWDLDTIAIPGYETSPEMMTWPMDHFKVAGEVKDPRSYGLQAVYYKLWLLSPQFAHNCVIQAGVPTRVYGKALPTSVVSLKFGDFEKTITMGEDDDEWEMTVPALKASPEPKLLHVTCTLDGEIAHERKITNVVVGDVWYVSATELKVLPGPGVPRSGPAPAEAWEGRNPQLRMLTSFAQRIGDSKPTRYKLNSSGKTTSYLFARWSPITGLTKELAERIHAKTGMPVGIVVLAPRKGTIKEWTGFDYLPKVKAWKADYDELYPHFRPTPESYVSRSGEYLKSWGDYWSKVKTDPSFESGELVSFPGPPKPKTNATQIYNQAICGFSPGNFKAALCLPSKGFVGDDATSFGPQVSAMANSWKDAFARSTSSGQAFGKEVIDPHFVCALPTNDLVLNLSKPTEINGTNSVIAMTAWPKIQTKRVEKDIISTVEDTAFLKLLDDAVNTVYK